MSKLNVSLQKNRKQGGKYEWREKFNAGNVFNLPQISRCGFDYGSENDRFHKKKIEGEEGGREAEPDKVVRWIKTHKEQHQNDCYPPTRNWSFRKEEDEKNISIVAHQGSARSLKLSPNPLGRDTLHWSCNSIFRILNPEKNHFFRQKIQTVIFVGKVFSPKINV